MEIQLYNFIKKRLWFNNSSLVLVFYQINRRNGVFLNISENRIKVHNIQDTYSILLYLPNRFFFVSVITFCSRKNALFFYSSIFFSREANNESSCWNLFLVGGSKVKISNSFQQCRDIQKKIKEKIKFLDKTSFLRKSILM